MMKKWLVVIGVLCLCFGCQKSKTKIYACQRNDQTIMFEAQGDQLLTQTEAVIMPFEELGITSDMAKDPQVLANIETAYRALYADIQQGMTITYEVDAKNQAIIFTHCLDYTEADLATLEALHLIDQGQADYISLKATLNHMQERGFACE